MSFEVAQGRELDAVAPLAEPRLRSDQWDKNRNAPRGSLAKRLWQYQKERFPLHKHGLLIAAFSFSGMSLSAALRGAASQPHPLMLAACFLTMLSLFAMLRIADEHKDQREDALYRPYLPVPRGLVGLGELRLVFVACLLLQFVINAALSWQLLILLSVIWSFMYLMSKEFFIAAWLRKHPVAYLLSHMAIVPLFDAYITACDWMPAGSIAPAGLIFFLILSFLNGIVLETGRKIRCPQEEERGVETYSALWGLNNSLLIWSAAVCSAAVFALLTAAASGTLIITALVVCVMLIAMLNTAVRAARGRLAKVSGQMERASGMWLLLVYLVLGLTPFIQWLRL